MQEEAEENATPADLWNALMGTDSKDDNEAERSNSGADSKKKKRK
jgi:hypothetical protein